MPRKLLLHQFESGATETWSWKTDVISTVANREQRIAIRDYPTEIFDCTIAFEGDGLEEVISESPLLPREAIVRNLHDLIVSRDEVTVALWQYADYVNTASSSFLSAARLSIALASVANQTPFYTATGEKVLIRTATSYHIATVESWNPVNATGVLDFISAPGPLASAFIEVVPLRDGLIQDGPKLTSAGFGDSSDANIAVRLYREPSATRVMVGNGGYTNHTNSFRSRPVVTLRSNVTRLKFAISQGTQRIETAANFPYYVTRWGSEQIEIEVESEFRRNRSAALAHWKALFATIRGAQGEFWLPTRRDDFEVLSTTGLTGCVLRGSEYATLWADTNQKALCIDDGTSIQVVRVVEALVNSDGNTEVYFGLSTTLVNPIQQVSLAVLCRLKTDDVKLTHAISTTTLSFTAVSVPIDWALPVFGNALMDVSFDDPDAELCDMIDGSIITSNLQAWFEADDADHTFNGTNYTALAISGNTSNAASVIGTGSLTRISENGRNLPLLGTAGIQFAGSGSNYAFLSNPATDAQISLAFKLNSHSAGGDNYQNRIFYTTSSTAGANGWIVALGADGRLRLLLRNASATVLEWASDVLTSVFDWVNVVIRRPASTIRIYLNGVEVYFNGSLAGLTADAHDHSPILGGRATREFNGVVGSCLLHSVNYGTNTLNAIFFPYLNRWRTAGPFAIRAIRGLPNRGSIGGMFRAQRLWMRPRVEPWREKQGGWLDLDNGTNPPSKHLEFQDTASFNFLRQSASYLVTIRFEAGPVNNTRLLLNTASAGGYRFYVRSDGGVQVEDGFGTNLVSSAGQIVERGRYTIQHYRTSSVRQLYINGVLVDTETGNTTSTLPSALQIGSSNFRNGHRLGRYVIHPGPIDSVRREFIRAQIEAEWPGYNSLDFGYEGGPVEAQLNGNYRGRMFADRNATPLRTLQNGREGSNFIVLAQTKDDSPVKLVSSPGAVVFGHYNVAVSAEFAGEVTVVSGPGPSVGIYGRTSRQYPLCHVRIATEGALGDARYQVSHDFGASWSAPRQTQAEVSEGPFRIVFADAFYPSNVEYRARASYMRDLSGQGNDLVAHPDAVPLGIVTALGYSTVCWFRTDPISGVRRIFQRVGLQGGRSILGRLTVSVVGAYGPFGSGGVLVAGGSDSTARRIGVRITDQPRFFIGQTSDPVGGGVNTVDRVRSLTARFNGASSTLSYEILGPGMGPPLTVDTVNPGAVVSNFANIAWGGLLNAVPTGDTENFRFSNLVLVDESAGVLSDNDVRYIHAKLEREQGVYGESFVYNTQAISFNNPLDYVARHLYSNSRNFAIAMVVRFDVADNDLELFRVGNVAGTAALVIRYDIVNGYGLRMTGSSGTVSLDWDADFPEDGETVLLEYRFTSHPTTPACELFLNNVSQGSQGFSSLAFNSGLVLDALPEICDSANQYVSIFEIRVLRDHTPQFAELSAKWGIA